MIWQIPIGVASWLLVASRHTHNGTPRLAGHRRCAWGI